MNPEDEQYVSVNADIEVRCSECDEMQIRDAVLEGDQSTLAYEWDCAACGHTNVEVYDTDNFLG
jgi:hypothetical protein